MSALGLESLAECGGCVAGQQERDPDRFVTRSVAPGNRTIQRKAGAAGKPRATATDHETRNRILPPTSCFRADPIPGGRWYHPLRRQHCLPPPFLRHSLGGLPVMRWKTNGVRSEKWQDQCGTDQPCIEDDLRRRKPMTTRPATARHARDGSGTKYVPRYNCPTSELDSA